MEELQLIGDTKTCTSALIIKNEKILLGLRNYTPDKWKSISVWTAPGGRCDDGEVIEDNLRRETLEEVGISDLKIEEFRGKVPGVKDGDSIFVFTCTTDQEPKLMEPEKFSEWKWFDLKALPENFINPHIRKLLDKTR